MIFSPSSKWKLFLRALLRISLTIVASKYSEWNKNEGIKICAASRVQYVYMTFITLLATPEYWRISSPGPILPLQRFNCWEEVTSCLASKVWRLCNSTWKVLNCTFCGAAFSTRTLFSTITHLSTFSKSNICFVVSLSLSETISLEIRFGSWPRLRPVPFTYGGYITTLGQISRVEGLTSFNIFYFSNLCQCGYHKLRWTTSLVFL